MADTFVPMNDYLRPPPPVALPAPCEDAAGALAAARRFGAAVADAVEAAVETLLRDIASDVLARELAIAPCDVAGVVSGALQRFAEEEPLAVVVHPSDRASAAIAGLPVRESDSLRPGDALLVLRHGSIDLSLGARLANVLPPRA